MVLFLLRGVFAFRALDPPFLCCCSQPCPFEKLFIASLPSESLFFPPDFFPPVHLPSFVLPPSVLMGFGLLSSFAPVRRLGLRSAFLPWGSSTIFPPFRPLSQGKVLASDGYGVAKIVSLLLFSTFFSFGSLLGLLLPLNARWFRGHLL